MVRSWSTAGVYSLDLKISVWCVKGLCPADSLWPFRAQRGITSWCCVWCEWAPSTVLNIHPGSAATLLDRGSCTVSKSVLCDTVTMSVPVILSTCYRYSTHFQSCIKMFGVMMQHSSHVLLSWPIFTTSCSVSVSVHLCIQWLHGQIMRPKGLQWLLVKKI